MLLKYIEKTNSVTDDELLSDLQATAKKVGKQSLTIAEYKEYERYDSKTIMRHFGTWNNALSTSGLHISNKQYTDRELFDNLAELWIKIGHQPSSRDLSLFESPISYKAYERRFGKWSIALKTFVDYYNSQESLDLYPIGVKPDAIHKTSRDINLRMRFKVMSRDNFMCCACSALPAKDSSVDLHVDHIIPWSRGEKQ